MLVPYDPYYSHEVYHCNSNLSSTFTSINSNPENHHYF